MYVLQPNCLQGEREVLTFATATRHIERSVSPGQLDDGTHVRCSGEKGESYAPPHGIGRIKGKLFH